MEDGFKIRLSDEPPPDSVPVTTDILGVVRLSDEPPDNSVPVPTIKFPTMGNDLVLELRVPADRLHAFDQYRTGHHSIIVKVVPE